VKKYDILILGSGMAGSVIATILAKLGYKVLLVEKGVHPRFALGESSTLITAVIFKYLAEHYDIPEFVPLATYDGAKCLDKPLHCGPKEYFHFFYHTPGNVDPRIDGEYPELVSQIPYAVPQYYRSDLDHRLVTLAIKYGVDYKELTTVAQLNFQEDGVTADMESEAEGKYSVSAAYVVDGSGYKSLLSEMFGLRMADDKLDTPLRSRSIFTHMRNVGSLEESVGQDTPQFNPHLSIDRRNATQHHCFDGGWYWFIPFDGGITSVGLSLDMDKFPMNDIDAELEFLKITSQFPIVQKMLSNATSVMPYVKTGRLQFLSKQIAGDRWVQLPAAAMGLDAWQSSGLAVSLISIYRIVESLRTRILPKGQFKRSHMAEYEKALSSEFHYLSRMVHGMYKSFRHFDIFRLYCMFPFIGTFGFLNNEEYKRSRDAKALIMHFGDSKFQKSFLCIYEKILECQSKQVVNQEDIELIRNTMLSDLAENNPRRYGDQNKYGIYMNQSGELRKTTDVETSSA
jgi:FADH2 O2-dependent halogenase